MNIFFTFLKSRNHDESGFVLVTSLLLLVVLTLIATSSIRSTTFEVKISGNDRVTKLNFYQAEGASRVAAQKLYNRDPTLNKDLLLPAYNKLADDPEGLIFEADKHEPFNDIKNLDIDGDNAITFKDLTPVGKSDTLGYTDRRAKVVLLPAVGTSLKLGSRLYSYGAYGASNLEKGFAMVQVGFKKRF
jgi:hypothetical protein